MMVKLQLRRKFRTGYSLKILATLLFSFCLALVTSNILIYTNYSPQVNTATSNDTFFTQTLAEWSKGEVRFLPILVPVSDNAEYLQQMIESLLKVEDLNKTLVVFSQEGNNKEVETILRNIPSEMNALYLHHGGPSFSISSLFATRWFPSAGNVEFLLSFAFETIKAPGAIILQSDLLPSIDMYHYFEWTFQTILQNPDFSNVLNINGFNTDPYTAEDIYHLTPDRFKPRGWCISAKKWPLLRDQWAKVGNWVYNVEKNVRVRYQMISLTPMVARVRNVRKLFNDIPYFFGTDDGSSPGPYNKAGSIVYKQIAPYLVMSRHSKSAVQGFRYSARSRKFGIIRHEH